jgi:predicted amidohydrolase YtcJ
MGDRIGSIEVGKGADLVVLGRDLFDVRPVEIHFVPVVLTRMWAESRIRHPDSADRSLGPFS